MKKAIISILSVASLASIMLTGCATKKEEAKIMSHIDGAITVDMSDYSSLQSNEGFMAITATQLVNSIGDENVNAIIYVGFKECDNCQNAIADIQSAAIATEQTVYYLDCDTQLELDSDYDMVYEALKPILISYNEEDPDDVQIYTPHVFKIEKGELVQGHVGYTEDYDYTSIMSFSEE